MASFCDNGKRFASTLDTVQGTSANPRVGVSNHVFSGTFLVLLSPRRCGLENTGRVELTRGVSTDYGQHAEKCSYSVETMYPADYRQHAKCGDGPINRAPPDDHTLLTVAVSDCIVFLPSPFAMPCLADEAQAPLGYGGYRAWVPF